MRARAHCCAVTSNRGAGRRLAVDLPLAKAAGGSRVPHEADGSWSTTVLEKFWGNGPFNMTITATNAVPPKGAGMNTKELVAKVASTAVVVLLPIATLSPGASAAQKPAAHAEAGTSTGLNRAPNAWSSRLSGLPTGGAALFDGIAPYGGPAFYNVPAAPAVVTQVAPNAWSSRLSGLQGGGAALYL